MRLSCPNCDAQYEVPDEVMPSEGRDVQCSNCGQTWFQHHPDHVPEDADERVPLDTPDPDEEVSPPPPADAPSPPPMPERKQLDPSVADILREEAEAEYAARQREAQGGLESQPELGLEESDRDPEPPTAPGDENSADAAQRRALEAKRRMSRMRGEPDPAYDRTGAGAAAAAGSRRALLPDIEEINSTLRTDKDRNRADVDVHGAAAAPKPKKQKRSFRRGFVVALLIFAIGALLYVYAPQIAQSVPQVDPYLSAYVGWVDQMRALLDTQVARLVSWLDGVASQTGE